MSPGEISPLGPSRFFDFFIAEGLWLSLAARNPTLGICFILGLEVEWDMSLLMAFSSRNAT
jgi:hypothetical protein